MCLVRKMYVFPEVLNCVILVFVPVFNPNILVFSADFLDFPSLEELGSMTTLCQILL